MAINKFGENLSFSEENILQPKEALADLEIAKRFVKMAKTLKRIAPKAEDFLYGHAVMMHAAEASLVNQETGEPVKNKKGEPSKGYFETIKIKGGRESVKWISPDDVKPYKNANGDIFPEAELLKAYKKWVGKPLCKDHKSDSVDGIRGIVIDTYYDPKFKRVHALFALDRKNYADLARKVETGYANCVSMGTAVGRSVCTECSNVAAVEKEYCNCIKSRSHYGEINLDLNPIELSLVVNGADGLAKIRNVIASMDQYVQEKTARIEQLKADRCVNPTELQQLSDSVAEMQKRIGGLMGMNKAATANNADLGELVAALKALETDPNAKEEVAKIKAQIKELLLGESELMEPAAPVPVPAPEAAPVAAANDARATIGGGEGYEKQSLENDSGKVGWPPFETEVPQRFASQKVGGENLTQDALSQELSLLRNKVKNMNNAFNELKTLISKEENNMNSARLRARAKARRAYWLGGGGVNEPTPGKPKYEKEDADSIRDSEDKQMVGEPLETGSEGLHPGDEEVKKKLLRAEENQDGLTTAELEDRRMKRRAYWLGGGGLNEPTPGKVKYPKEEADKIRNNEDKHMQAPDNMGGTDGAFPGDMEVKKKLLRAKLRAKLVKVADQKGNLVKDASRWDIYAGDQLILSAAGSEVYEDELDDNWDYFSSKQYGSDVLKMIRTEGFDQVAYLLKGAQDPMMPAAPEAAAPAAPAPAAELPPPAPAAAPAEAPKAEGVNLEKVNAALSTMEEKIAELRDLLGKEGSGLVDVDVNVGEKGPMDKVLSFREDALKVESLLNDAADELALVSETLEGLDKVEAGNKDKLLKAAADVLADSDVVLTEANIVIEAAKAKKDKKEDKEEKADKKDKKEEKAEKKEKEDKKDKKEDKDDKKAEAQKLLDDALKVRAQNRAALLKAAMGMYGEDADLALDPKTEDDLKKLLQDEKSEMSPEGGKMHPDLAADMAKDKKKDDDDEEDVEVEEGEEEDEKEDKEDDAMMADVAPEMCACGPEGHAQDCMMAADPMAAGAGMAPGAPVVASRKTAREALVARAEGVLGKYELDLGKAQNATEPTYFQAHPGGKGTVTELTSTKTQEAKVETISEVHEVMRDVAESGPRNVREAAAVLQEKIVEGAVKAEDVERLVAEGKVDSAAAAYWKKYFAQAPQAGSFGADLSKEFAKGKKEASDNNYKLKLRRAYDIAIQAQEKGLISGTRDSLDTYVDEIMHFDDAAFESNKRVVANYKSTAKKGGTLPRVGLEAASAAMTATASANPSPESSLVDQLGSLGWK